ncbi:TonB-denpendent receptor [Flavobacterium gilvum]|nr:TonB-denpendent receptor [Flavobacterium gilvum]
MCFQNVNAQNKTISGVITDNANMPVPGVTVKEKGSKEGAITDESGAFKISAKEGATLVVSSIGFKTVEVKAADGVKVKMQGATNELEGVTVTALGQSKKNKAIGYATSIIKSDAIVKTGSPTVANALYGKAPGVRISSTPGGTGVINIQIRGVNSITGKNQPLIVVDGVPIRDGEVNNNDYWAQQRVKSNGFADLNPEDIENISILKGASAAALYGSEAVNGVVLVTTKSGTSKKGLGVDFNTSFASNPIAYTPKYQNVRGAGDTDSYSGNDTRSTNGFVMYDTNGDGIKDMRGIQNVTRNFGPKFDGQPIMSWDGIVRPYSFQKDGFKNLFQNSWDATTNISISSKGENSNTRFSYTHYDSQGLSLGHKIAKNTFNLNTSFKVGTRSKTDIVVNYINQNVNNRARIVHELVNGFGGMIGTFDNGDWYKGKYQTSLGYKYVEGAGTQSLTPSENIIYNGFKGDIGNFMWNVNANQELEKTNRLMASITETFDITKELKVKGRISTDLTSINTEDENRVDKPLVYGFGPGSFSMRSDDYNLTYADVMLTYNKQINDDFNVNALVGYSGSQETVSWLSRSTSGGLSVEGWYDMNASVNTPSSDSYRKEVVKDALFGTLSGSFKNYLFVEATLRRDRTSTMNPNNNSFIYPSINTSFILSDAVKLPEVINYAKIRGSWGKVGNYPDPYRANVAFNQSTLGTQGTTSPILITNSSSSYGNEGIKPEMKNEIEVGFETKFLDRRLGLDFSYYNAKIKDQILDMSLAPTTGATSILANVGELSNQGFEIALTGSPIRTQDFSWDVTLNWAKNINKIVKLANGATELLHADYEDGAQLKSVVGESMGGLYAHPIRVDANGKQIVGDDGTYQLDGDKWEKYGTAMPSGIGGLINSFTYKAFTLDVNIDYSYGGYVMPSGISWLTSRGLTEKSLGAMDTEHGGLSYYQDKNQVGYQVPVGTTAGPNGERVFNDGMLMDGVLADGSVNKNVIPQERYYNYSYNWGGPKYGSNSIYKDYIQRNDYIKLRELSLAYALPTSIANRIGASKISFSVFGRNLFYFYRTVKDMDAEATTAGSRWSQNVNNAGLTPSTRTFGGMLRVSF